MCIVYHWSHNVLLVCDKSVTTLNLWFFRKKILKVLKCYNFLWVQWRHNCCPAASFANCVMTLYLLKVHLQTFLSIPISQKCQILSCDTLAANEWYIMFSLLLFVINIKNWFKMHSEIHNINTRNNSDFYEPLSHLTIYQKGPFYVGIKVYNSLPPKIKDLSQNSKKFKSSLRVFLHQHSFYTLEEYFNYKAVVWYSLTTKLIFIIVSLVWNFEVCFHT